MRKSAYEIAGRRVIPIVRFDVDKDGGELTVETAYPIPRALTPSLIHVEGDDTDEREMTRLGDTTFSARITGWSGYIVASG